MWLAKLLIMLLNKMRNIFFYFFFSFLIISCSNYTFVYSDKKDYNFLKETYFLIAGSDIDIIRKHLTTKKGSGKRGEKYQLNISSQNENRNSVIDNDQTSSLVEIQYNIRYRLFDNLKNCKVMEKKISTSANYNSRAEGYNFGSDLNKNQLSKQLIKKNIDQFLQYIVAKSRPLDCI